MPLSDATLPNDTSLLNCWEFKKCGREKGGRKTQADGICPASIDTLSHGINHGHCGGRYCWKALDTLCEGTPQNDLESKRINCVMCDFYKQVMKEEGPSFKGVDEEFTQDPSKILYYLHSAFHEDKMLEIILDDRVRLFFTRFMDHLPELIPITDDQGDPKLDESGAPLTMEPHYVPGTYLHKRSHLLIQPLTPALGNAQIRSCQKVTLRFFEGVKSFETQMDYQGITVVRGEPGIKLSFPEWLSISRKRTHFRVTIPEYITSPITVEKPGYAPTTVRLLDISPGGLSFCHSEVDPDAPPDPRAPKPKGLPPPILQDGDTLQLQIQPKDLPGVTIKGFLRRKVCACDRQCRGKNRYMVGVQFDLQERTTENRLLEIVSYFQRIHAQDNQSRRLQKERMLQINAVTESCAERATQQLFEEKSKFSQNLSRILPAKIWS